MPGCDRDLVQPLEKRIARALRGDHARHEGHEDRSGDEGHPRALRGRPGAGEPQVYDRVLVAVGRSAERPQDRAPSRPASTVNERGFIQVDKQMRTNVPHIFAIGDIVGQPMLAHKATHEGKVAAEVAAGRRASSTRASSRRSPTRIPRSRGSASPRTRRRRAASRTRRARFPWAASARSLTLGRDEGFTKLLFDPDTHRVLGAGIVGTNAGDLIAEVALAIEMGATRPTSASRSIRTRRCRRRVAFAAEASEGTLTDLYIPKKLADSGPATRVLIAAHDGRVSPVSGALRAQLGLRALQT